jgi:hypothetical protein
VRKDIERGSSKKLGAIILGCLLIAGAAAGVAIAGYNGYAVLAVLILVGVVVLGLGMLVWVKRDSLYDLSSAERETNYMGVGIAIGAALGVAYGIVLSAATDKPGLFSVGLSAGLGSGVAIGAALNARTKRNGR